MNKKNMKIITVIIVLIIIVGVGLKSINRMQNNDSNYVKNSSNKLEGVSDFSEILKDYDIDQKDIKEIKKQIKLEEGNLKRNLTSEEIKSIIEEKINNNDDKESKTSELKKNSNKNGEKDTVNKKENPDVKILVENGAVQGTTAIVVELVGVKDSSKYEVKVNDTNLDYYAERKKFGGFVEEVLNEKQVSEKLRVNLK